jgi:hypothetical protein
MAALQRAAAEGELLERGEPPTREQPMARHPRLREREI